MNLLTMILQSIALTITSQGHPLERFYLLGSHLLVKYIYLIIY